MNEVLFSCELKKFANDGIYQNKIIIYRKGLYKEVPLWGKNVVSEGIEIVIIWWLMRVLCDEVDETFKNNTIIEE